MGCLWLYWLLILSAKLAQLLPPAASLNNPVDMLASASPEQFAACLQVLLADPGVNGVLVVTPPPPMHTTGAVAKVDDPGDPEFR